MWRKIKEIGFADLIEQIRRATNARTRTACDPILQSKLAFIKDKRAALRSVRNSIALAALDTTKTVAELHPNDPLVQALVRCMHHPDAEPPPTLQVQRGLDGLDASPRLSEIAASHPELDWDVDKIQELLIRAIVARAGEAEVDDELPPWRISWEPAGAAAYALLVLVTFHALGDV